MLSSGGEALVEVGWLVRDLLTSLLVRDLLLLSLYQENTRPQYQAVWGLGFGVEGLGFGVVKTSKTSTSGGARQQ